MKTPFKFRAPPVKAQAINAQAINAQAINKTIRSALAAAGLDTKAGQMRGVTDIIRRSLAAAQLPPTRGAAVANEDVIDVVARAVKVGGSFESYEYANRAGTRAYKLYVPAQIVAAPPVVTPLVVTPLVVMLHGCTQSSDDFAAGARMNQLADQHGFLVAYPEQPSSANPSKCWNWFKAQDQVRDSGEPSLIVGITRDVAARHHVDPRRIFVAGMSAGAAMAVILGETYPDVFAGVGVHSGLPYRSANDIPSAMLAMKGGRSGMPALKMKGAAEAAAPQKIARHPVPVIVFHGDRDHTVQQSNALEIVRQAQGAHARARVALNVNTERGDCASGRSYTRVCYADAKGKNRIESWTVHGAGHAWSGGDASGSYTDVSGPDASAEMVRFFLALA